MALSDLWLDTEHRPRDLNQIVQTLAASPYSPAEIEAIHWREVAPVVGNNAFAIPGGIWGGFDPAAVTGEFAEAALAAPTWRVRLRDRWWRWIGNDDFDTVMSRLAERPR